MNFDLAFPIEIACSPSFNRISVLDLQYTKYKGGYQKYAPGKDFMLSLIDLPNFAFDIGVCEHGTQMRWWLPCLIFSLSMFEVFGSCFIVHLTFWKWSIYVFVSDNKKFTLTPKGQKEIETEKRQ